MNTLRDDFDQYVNFCFSKDITQKQRLDLRGVFYAGAYCGNVLSLKRFHALKQDTFTLDEVKKVLKELDNEISDLFEKSGPGSGIGYRCN